MLATTLRDHGLYTFATGGYTFGEQSLSHKSIISIHPPFDVCCPTLQVHPRTNMQIHSSIIFHCSGHLPSIYLTIQDDPPIWSAYPYTDPCPQ